MEKNVALAPWTTWKIGGEALYYTAPSSIEEVIEAKRFADENQLHVFYLGRGSNVLFDSAGFTGVVIHTSRNFNSFEVQEDHIYAEAGVPLPKLSISLSRQGIEGFDFFAGIPGTVGGAIVMNAGCIGKETSDVLQSVIYINDQGELIETDADQLDFDFRTSCFQDHSEWMILACRFKLSYGTATVDQAKEAIVIRKAKFPLKVATAGSTFKSRPNGPYPGKLVEEAGLKGCTCGDAYVSKEHGNWIINRGNATSEDVIQLMTLMQHEVEAHSGIKMEPEVIVERSRADEYRTKNKNNFI